MRRAAARGETSRRATVETPAAGSLARATSAPVIERATASSAARALDRRPRRPRPIARPMRIAASGEAGGGGSSTRRIERGSRPGNVSRGGSANVMALRCSRRGVGASGALGANASRIFVGAREGIGGRAHDGQRRRARRDRLDEDAAFERSTDQRARAGRRIVGANAQDRSRRCLRIRGLEVPSDGAHRAALHEHRAERSERLRRAAYAGEELRRLGS